jgi:hypothetical protein
MRGRGLSGAEDRDLEEISAAARHHRRRSDGWHKRRGEMRWWSGRQTGAPLHHVLPRETETAATERDSAGRGCRGAARSKEERRNLVSRQRRGVQ